MRQQHCVFDAATARRTDANGYLHVASSHLTKEQIAPYLGREIGGWEELGLEPERIYHGLRPADELEKAVASFNGLPLQSEHHPDSAAAPQKLARVGSLGTSAAWNPPYIDNALTVTDAAAIEAIESGRCRELSCAYLFDADFTPGVWQGRRYDFVMRNIRGNHVALVEAGRAGPDVSVADAASGGVAGDETPAASGPAGILRTSGAETDPAKSPFRAADNPETKGTDMKPKLPAFLRRALELDENASPDDALALFCEGLNVDATGRERLAGLLARIVEAAPAETAPGRTPEQKAGQGGGEKPGRGAEGGPAASGPAERPSAADGPDAAGAKRSPATPGASAPGGPDAEAFRRQAAADARTAAQEHFRALYGAAALVRPLSGEVDPLAFDSAEDIYAHVLTGRGVRPEAYPREAWRGMVDMILRSASEPLGLFGSANGAADFDPFAASEPFSRAASPALSAADAWNASCAPDARRAAAFDGRTARTPHAASSVASDARFSPAPAADPFAGLARIKTDC